MPLQRPLLEVGCGSGVFRDVALPPVDVALDLEGLADCRRGEPCMALVVAS